MRNTTIKQVVALLVCALLIICVGLFWWHNERKTNSLFSILHVSSSDITRVELQLEKNEQRTELNTQQVIKLCNLLNQCSLKFKSSSSSFTNCYGRIFLSTTQNPYPNIPTEIMFSTQYIGVVSHDSGRITTYTIVDGGDVLKQYLGDRGTVLLS